MSKRSNQVFRKLKVTAKSLGYNEKELKSVAANIADNLDLDDDASEEDVNAAIDSAVAGAIPFLQVGQRAANRVVQQFKDSQADLDEEDDDDDGDDTSKPTKNDVKGKKKSKTDNQDSELVALLKSMKEEVGNLKGEVIALKSGKLSESRKAKLEAVLKDTGAYGKSTLKAFSKMSFADDDDFEEYLDGIKDDVEAINKERTESGLGKLGVPNAGGGHEKKEKKDDEPMSDDEIDSMASGM